MELGNIISDPATINLEDVTKKLGLASIAESKNTIEIRLYSNIGFKGTQCEIIEYSTKWKASKFKLNAKDSAIKVTLKSTVALDKIVQALIAHNVFSLPAQDNIKTANYKFDPATNQVMLSEFNLSDAPCYYIQFKVGDKLRQYKYCGAAAYAAFYKTQHEYTDFNEIVKVLGSLK